MPAEAPKEAPKEVSESKPAAKKAPAEKKSPLHKLVVQWREQADAYSAKNRDLRASAMRRCADELEEALK